MPRDERASKEDPALISSTTAPTPPVGGDHPIEKVRLWIEEMGRRGLYGSESARFRATAVSRLTSVLGESEPRNTLWVLEHLDELGERYLRKTQGNRDTIKTYVSRAKVSLRDYLTFQRDPAGFPGRISKPRLRSRERQDADARREQSGTEHSNPSATPPPASSPPDISGAATHLGEMMRLPLGEDGREFLYHLPRGGIKVHEVARIYWHLLTVATDFEPPEATTNQMSFLARGKEP